MPHLIVFSHLRWGFVYQRPQHLMTRLAHHSPVVFIEEPVRAEGPPRLVRTVHAPGIEVWVPHTPADAPGFHDDQLPALLPLVAGQLRVQDIDDYLVWCYTPMALPLAVALEPRALVYDCMDELSAFSHAPRQLRQRETALLRQANVVLTGGPALYAVKRDLNPNVHCLPSAVDAVHYAPSRLDASSAEAHESERLQGHLPRPRLGFFGVIDERLDLDLIDRLARERPDWQIVMCGPVVKIDPQTLPQHANLYWLGMQTYERLPYLMAGWDVCLMPFALNESTRFISPTKTLEYMAGGKPVVSTAVGDVIDLYGDTVRIAHDGAAFVTACADALAETAMQRAERLVAMAAVVQRSSWDEGAARVKVLLDDALRRRLPAIATTARPAASADATSRGTRPAVGAAIAAEPASVGPGVLVASQVAASVSSLTSSVPTHATPRFR